MENQGQHLLFVVILLVYLLAGALYMLVTPAWQNPDEPAHYNYISALAGHGAFPELVASCYNQDYLLTLVSSKFPKDMSIEGVCYEFHQPPLYYALAVPVFLFTDGQLLAIRAVSVLFGVLTIVLVYHTGRTVFPSRPEIALGAMALTAFVPMHAAILASVNNDALAGLFFAGILFLLIRRLRPATIPSVKEDILLGMLLGFVLVTKITVYIAVPLTGITLLFLTATRRHALLRPMLTVFSLALLIALPWYVRNAALYGGFDILGLQRHDEVVVGQLRTSDFIAEVGGTQYLNNFIITTFHSFWGQFGWMAVPMDPRTYRLLLLLTIVAGSGLVAFLITKWRRSITAPQKQMLALLSLSMLATLFAYIWYNLSFVQFQGRYLFSAIVPLAVLAAIGLSEASQDRWRWGLTGGLLVAAALTVWGSGGLDKWAALIVGGFAFLSGARIFLPQWSSVLSTIFLVGCYSGVAFLAVLSPFWFIQPYL
jgi:4-amino-4-deoxy-L-arabinose transferase-like glycosyltransferase